MKDAKLTSSVETLELLTDYKVEEFPYSFEECMKMAYKNRADLKAYNSTLDAVKENLVYVEPWKLIKNQIINKKPKTEIEQKIDSLIQKRIRFLKHKSH